MDSLEERMTRMVAEYQVSLLRLCYAWLHDEELAKDAVQETFIKAYRRLDSYREDASEMTWLCAIAINTCKDVRRSGWFRHVDRAVSLDRLPEAVSPPDESEQALTLEIMKLPIKLREAALLCWYQGLTYSEAAESLGISPQAVGSRLERARRKLRRALEGRDEHDPV